MLTGPSDVEHVVQGKDGVLEGMMPGSVVIEMGTISPAVSEAIASQFTQKGFAMLDAPVSGSVGVAVAAAFTIQVGGDAEVFEAYRDVLATMGKSIFHVGGNGGKRGIKVRQVAGEKSENINRRLIIKMEIKRSDSIRELYTIFTDTAITSAMIFFVLGAAAAFSNLMVLPGSANKFSIGTLSTKYGKAEDMVLSMEVVLPTGLAIRSLPVLFISEILPKCGDLRYFPIDPNSAF